MTTPIDSTSRHNARQLEIKYVHPATAEWLTAHGYTHQHEVVMPEYGRVDFLATHTDGHKLLVECKYRATKKFGRELMQLIDYRRQLPESRAAFSIPADMSNEYIQDLCSAYDVQLILVDVPLVAAHQQIDAMNDIESSIATRFAFIDSCRSNPKGAIKKITEFHEQNGTNPALDLAMACQRAMVLAYDLIGSLDAVRGTEDRFQAALYEYAERHTEYIQDIADAFRLVIDGNASYLGAF